MISRRPVASLAVSLFAIVSFQLGVLTQNAEAAEPKLYMYSGNTLSSGTLRPGASQSTLFSSSSIYGNDMFLDSAKGYVYFSDYSGKLQKVSSSIPSQSATTVFSQITQNSFKQLAFDPYRRNLYWTTSSNNVSVIRSINLDTGVSSYNSAVYVGYSSSQILDLQIDPIGGYLYWHDHDWQVGGEIWRKSIYGGGPVRILYGDALLNADSQIAVETLDPANPKIYWIKNESGSPRVFSIMRGRAYGTISDVEKVLTMEVPSVTYLQNLVIDTSAADAYWVAIDLDSQFNVVKTVLNRKHLLESTSIETIQQSASTSYFVTAGTWNISGKVLSPSGVPVSGVTAKLVACDVLGNACVTKTVTTGLSNSFIFPDIAHGSKYTLTISKTGYYFSPTVTRGRLYDELKKVISAYPQETPPPY